MAFSYLKPDNLLELYKDSKEYTEGLIEDHPELHRIANNEPKAGIDPAYPKVTDGTTASIVRKTPKRLIQQIPTGIVESDDDNDWLPIVAMFIFLNKILPKANEDYDFIQKCWTLLETGLTVGSQATYTPFVMRDGEFTTDCILLYSGDVFIQRGKKSGYASNYVFMRAWWQPADIDRLIDSQESLAKSARKRGEQFTSRWDLENLRTIRDRVTAKNEEAKTPEEKKRKEESRGVEIVTAVQVGVDAPFYTFYPSENEDKSEEALILMEENNPDPRGRTPIDWFYADIDGSNPLGRSFVKLVAGLQNLIDGDMQMYQFNRALMLAPPLVVANMDKKRIRYVPNSIIDKGSNPEASIDTLKIDTSAVTNYPNLYGLQKSQLLNLLSAPDSSISAEVGNPGFSKTAAGVRQQQANVSVDDNYLRKMFEAWFENWAETAINLYFARRQGTEVLQLDKETADKLRALEAKGLLPVSEDGAPFVSEDDKITIDYSSATPVLKFRVDASTSKINEESAQLEALQALGNIAASNEMFAQIIPAEKWAVLWNSIVNNSSVEDTTDLEIDVEELKAQQQAMAEQQALQAEQAGQVAPDVMGEDEMIAQELRALGVTDEATIQEALQLLDAGYTDDEIIEALGVAV